MTNKSCCYLFAAVLLFCAVLAHSQVEVSLAPPLHPKFTDANGVALGDGFLYSYAAGTNSPQATYVDSSGITQNLNPIPLDATGAPSNGSVSTQIWLANQSYKFCAYNSFNVLQWCADNIQGQLALLNLANEWSQPQIFDLAIQEIQTDNQFVLGVDGQLTILDFPPPLSNITLHFPTTGDTMVGRNTTDTMTNKNLVVPQINGVPVNNSPGTYFNIVNGSPIGTAVNDLILLNSDGSAGIVTVGVQHGVIGICINNCGSTGSATIQQSGLAFCNFDGATSIGQYVLISSITNGACHASESTSYPSVNTGQVLGRVLQAVGSGAAVIELFGGEQFTGASISYPAIPTVTPGTGAGTSPTIACTDCHDNGGYISVTTGSSPAATSVVVTLTFSQAYNHASCTLTPGNSNASALTGATQVSSFPTTTTLAVSSGGTNLTASTMYQWNYTCNFNF